MKRLLVILVTLAACSTSSLQPPPLKQQVRVTTDSTLSPALARQDSTAGPNPASDPFSLARYTEAGYGVLNASPGLGYTTHTFDGSTPPTAGPHSTRIARFVHLTDLQIADDESPTRVASFDSPIGLDAAARPQDSDLCRMTNAAVRTINALHHQDPIDFVLLGGDNADSAQSNEVDWALSILTGAKEVKCDSGAVNDPVPGPDNDGKDAFYAEGLEMPFKWVTGNHDVTVQGDFPITQFLGVELGSVADSGTRDYTQPGGPIRAGDFVVPDAARKLLDRHALMTKIAASGDGHGIGAAQIASGKATYTFDVPGTPLRLLTIDTATEDGGAEGVIHQADVDALIKPALDRALADGKWVFLASHHGVSSLSTDGGIFGKEQADAVLPDDWVDFVGQYPNVIFGVMGHTHRHNVKVVKSLKGGQWWEVMTSSIADYPHQFHMLELFDQDNGWLMLRATAVDFSTVDDVVAKDARERGTIDWQSGWGMDNGLGDPANRNVELWMKKPVRVGLSGSAD